MTEPDPVEDPSPAAAEPAPARTRRRFGGFRAKLIALLISVSLPLLAGEFAVRHFLHNEVDTEALRRVNRHLFIGDLIEPAENPELLYRLKPALHEEWRNVLVATSANASTRISTFNPPPENPALRIAVLGDSTPFGFRIYYDAAYPEVLRVQLEAALGVPIELRNYSAPGYNSVQERIVLESMLEEWRPDLVILHYDHNDPDPPVGVPPGYNTPEYGDNILRSALVKFAIRFIRYKSNLGSRTFVGEDGSMEKSYGGLRTGGVRYDTHIDELRRIGAKLRAEKIPVIAVIFDHALKYSKDPLELEHYTLLHAPLVQRLEEGGFHVLDLYPEYHRMMRERDWANLRPFWVIAGDSPDSHPNPLGHAFIGEHLGGFIRSNTAIFDHLRAAAASSAAAKLDRARNEAATAYQRALVMITEQQFGEAKPLLLQAVAQNPRDPGVRMNLANVLAHLNDLPNSEIQLREAISLMPDFALPHLQLAQVCIHQCRFDEAMEERKKAVALLDFSGDTTSVTETVADTFALIGTNLIEDGNTALASQALQHAIDLNRLINKNEKAASLEKKRSALP